MNFCMVPLALPLDAGSAHLGTDVKADNHPLGRETGLLHALFFKLIGALSDGRLEVIIGLIICAANYDVLDDAAGILVERCDNVAVAGTC